MAGAVYLLCAATSLVCTVLLLRKLSQTRIELLLWSDLCFGCLTINNLGLYTDMVVFPERDYSLLRELPALIGIVLLLYGLIWKSRE